MGSLTVLVASTGSFLGPYMEISPPQPCTTCFISKQEINAPGRETCLMHRHACTSMFCLCVRWCSFLLCMRATGLSSVLRISTLIHFVLLTAFICKKAKGDLLQLQNVPLNSKAIRKDFSLHMCRPPWLSLLFLLSHAPLPQTKPS